MITHIVLFKLKNQTEDNRQKAKEVLLGMTGKISQLKYIEVGTDVMHSERSYDIALITKFDSLEDLAAYQIHPEHVKVGAYFATVRESALVVDYES
jgi:hypothetical protein